jgi:hypothetical protein
MPVHQLTLRRFLRWFQQPWALRAYRRKLGPYLQRQHGPRSAYSLAQIDQALSALGLSHAFLGHALAMYGTVETFETYHRQRGEDADFVLYRLVGFGTFGVRITHPDGENRVIGREYPSCPTDKDPLG